MEILLAFGLGWVIGSRSTAEGYREVVAALEAVRQSDEFKQLVQTVRTHAVNVAREVAGQLSPEQTPPAEGMDDVLARVRALVRTDLSDN